MELANSGQFPDAILKLRNEISMQQAIYACDELPRQTIDGLIANCKPGLDERNSLVLELVRDLALPQRQIMGGMGLDMDEARRYLLEKLGDRPAAAQAYPAAAYRNCFYPEYMTLSKRERVVSIAESHVDLGPDIPRQVNLFSLGGCFTWNLAKAETNPSGTTCGKAVRSFWFAAGCRPMTDWHAKKSTMHNYIGIGGLGAGHPAFVPFSTNRWPRAGDAFWIHKGTMKYQGQDVDDSHVGLIVKVISPTVWETIEGGQDTGGKWTRKKTRTIVPKGTKAVFQGGDRWIQGWVDIDKFDWAF